MYYQILVLGILAAILFLTVRVKEGGVRGLMTKAFASALFISTAIVAFSESSTAGLYFPHLVIIGLVFGLLGDVWLDLKWVYPKDNDIYTFAGFISFGIEHVLCLIGLFTYFADFSKIWYIIIPLIASVVIGLAVALLEKPMKLDYGKFKAISAIYAFILTYLTLQFGSLAFLNNFESLTLNFMFLGGILFLISDLILCGTYFGEGKRRPADIISNHATYYIAQFLFASSLLFLK